MRIKRLLVIGFGSVSRTVFCYWDRVLPDITWDELYVVEPEEIPSYYHKMITKHIRTPILPNNYQKILNEVKATFILDLSVNVFSVAIINYCAMKGTPYLSTALESWEDEEKWSEEDDMYQSSLLYDQRSVLQINSRPGVHPTIMVDCGYNPGLVSSMALEGIERLAKEEGVPFTTHAETAKALNICVIQCSEVDTQTTIYDGQDFDKNVFYNDWSSVGYFEESILPVQLGWGSHEAKLDLPHDVDPEQIFIRKRGMDMQCLGYNPIVGKYYGRLIPHGEAASLPRYLTFGDYRPSSYYVYKSSHVSQKSLEELKKNDYEMLPYYHVVRADEVIDGEDAVGALFIRKDGSLYWCGSVISKKDIPLEFHGLLNPTTVQVASGVLAGISWVLNNPNRGVCFPESMDNNKAIALTEKFLGKVIFSKMPGKLSPNFKTLVKR